MNWSTDMATTLTRARQGNGVLFAEDFDRPGPVPDPEVIAPSYTASDLEQARAAAREEGRAAGLAEHLADDEAGMRHAMIRLVAGLDAAEAALHAAAEQTAEEIARVLLASLAALFPVLCENHGDAEACAIARAILPGLANEPRVEIRASPHTGPAVMREIARLAADHATRFRMIPTDDIPPGDLRVSWRDGAATRDTAAMWRDIEAILLPHGLLATAIMETQDGP